MIFGDCLPSTADPLIVPPMQPSPTTNTTSGIKTTPSGIRHIPASTRADGSTRREIKIRPGYKPPEDIEIYKNRTAEAWKTRGKGERVPGAGGLDDEDNIGSKIVNTKNSKRREARRRAKIEATDETTVKDKEPDIFDLPDVELSRASSTDQAESWRRSTLDPVEPPDPEAEKEKQARNLRKKLRQARDLREKKDKGESLLPEQLEKVIKINELIRQLDGLGFDTDEQKKAD